MLNELNDEQNSTSNGKKHQQQGTKIANKITTAFVQYAYLKTKSKRSRKKLAN